MTKQKALHPRDDVTDYIYQERREEEDLSGSKTALTHRYNDSRTAQKKHEAGLITPIKNYTDNSKDNKMIIKRKLK